MALDPSIILQAGRGVTPIADPMEQAAKAQSLMGAMLQLQQQKQAMADHADFRKQYGMSPGMAKSVHEVSAAKLQEQKAEREAQKAKLEAIDVFNQKQLSVYNSIKDEASYRAALPVLAANAQQFGIDTSQSDHPTVYDPRFVETKKAQMMSFDQQLKAQKARFDMDKPQTDLGQLEADFKAGRVQEPDYIAKKQKLTTHAPGTAVYTGTLVPGVDAEGRPAFAMPSKDGNIKIVPGFQPQPKEKSKGKMDIDKLDAVIGEAEKLIEKGPGSYLGAGFNLGKRLVGVSDEATQAAAGLKALEAQLMMNMPRMEGPQSDKDVALYRQQAGQIGDPTVPAGDKKAALKVIKDLTSKYRSAVSDTPVKPEAPAAPKKVGTKAMLDKWMADNPTKKRSEGIALMKQYGYSVEGL